ncbi:MAG TPA: nucleotidyltransferase family protein [Pyrinomonadaceae bacterium]
MNADLSEEKWILLHEEANRRRVSTATKYFRDAGIAPVLLKGWSIARFYDPAIVRVYSDIDLAVDPVEEDQAVRLWRAYPHGENLIDLHFGLRRLDKLPWRELVGASYVLDLDGTSIRVLADEDNLRVTAVHWLTDGGVNKERLWDIFYLVKNRKEDFDWERCLESNGPVRKTWVMAAIATARDHLNLDVSGLPEEAQRFQLPSWYKKTLDKEWKRGVYPRRILATVITRPKLLAEQLYRRFPPNKIAATIDTESPIDESSRIPAQIKSLTNKIVPFARGLARRLTYSRHSGKTKP